MSQIELDEEPRREDPPREEPRREEPPRDDGAPPERIGAEGTEPAGASPRTGLAETKDLEEMLDAALACTFPASDPIGCLSPAGNCPPAG
jgi:hypothetical protein